MELPSIGVWIGIASRLREDGHQNGTARKPSSEERHTQMVKGVALHLPEGIALQTNQGRPLWARAALARLGRAGEIGAEPGGW